MSKYELSQKILQIANFYLPPGFSRGGGGDYEMMPVCACMRALVSHTDFSKTTAATDFL